MTSFVQKLLSSLQSAPQSSKAETNVPQAHAQSAEQRLKRFEQAEEIVWPETGHFISIGKVKVLHVMKASNGDSSEFAARLIQMCIRIDDHELSYEDVMNMELKMFMTLSEKLTSQINK